MKQGQADFRFIAKHPSAMLIAGGILFLLIDKNALAWVLILLGILLHIFWLAQR